MSYEDVREIDELDKIWKTRGTSKFIDYLVASFIIFILVMIVFCFLALTGLFVFFLIDTIIAYLSGRDPNNLVFLVPTGIGILFVSLRLFLPLLLGIKEKREDLRCLIRFRISSVVDLSAYNYNVIEGLTQTLEKKGTFSGRKYERENINYTQLNLALAYLTKKYGRDVSSSEYSQFFSMGTLSITTKYIRCFFVMLDEKRGEVLFYSNSHQDWASIHQALKDGNFLLSEVNETIVDMEKYVINKNGSIEEKKQKNEEFLIQ